MLQITDMIWPSRRRERHSGGDLEQHEAKKDAHHEAAIQWSFI
jgi:hypothetical protein